MSILDNKEKMEAYFINEPNDKIALIDADTIAFNACLDCEVQSYNAETGEDEWSIDLTEAFEYAKGKIDLIQEQTGTINVELHFSGPSSKGFRRLEVTDTYKANRVNTRYPEGLQDLKIMLNQTYEGTIAKYWEADDSVVALYNSEKHILAAIDKDVLNTIPGKHWNYYQRAAYSRETKAGLKHYEAIPAMFVETSESFAAYWPFYQCIIGDTIDGYKGVPGMGDVGAKKYISEDKTPQQNWQGVVKAFESKGLTEIEAITTMRLVNMHQLNIETNKIELWSPICLDEY